MGSKTTRISTSLSVKQCAELFQASPRQLMSGAAKFQGLVAKASGGVFTADFFAPQETGPFAALDDDPPTFSAGTFIRNGASAPNPTEVHMYVWDRGSSRDVAIIAAHGLVTGQQHARSIVRRLGEMFRQRDGRAQISSDA